MLEGIFGNASAEKILLYLEQYEEGYATAIARTFDDLSLNMAQRPLEETIRDFAERETRMGTLRLLAPTECVMDRLAWYFHDADTQCLEQAVRVATLHPVDLKRIARWARGERPHGAERFQEFERRPREDANA